MFEAAYFLTGRSERRRNLLVYTVTCACMYCIHRGAASALMSERSALGARGGWYGACFVGATRSFTLRTVWLGWSSVSCIYTTSRWHLGLPESPPVFLSPPSPPLLPLSPPLPFSLLPLPLSLPHSQSWPREREIFDSQAMVLVVSPGDWKSSSTENGAPSARLVTH